MKKQYIWQELQRYGRHLQGRYHLIALFFVIAVALFVTTSTTSHVYAASATACRKTYTVARGDTLNAISQTHKTTAQRLSTLNGIANPNLIYVGQKLCLSGSWKRGPANYPSPLPAPHGTISQIIYRVFGGFGAQAIRVASCESGLNPNAYNSAQGAAGLFQIMPGTWRSTSQAGQSPYNAAANTRAAYEIFARDGYSWREWGCRA